MKKREINKEKVNKILNLVKLVIYIVILVLSYKVSNRAIDYILTLSTEVLKRILNTIFVVFFTIIYLKK